MHTQYFLLLCKGIINDVMNIIPTLTQVNSVRDQSFTTPSPEDVART